MSALLDVRTVAESEPVLVETEPADPFPFTAGSVIVGYLDAGQWSACFGLSYRDLLLADAFGANRIVRPGGRELRSVTGSGGIPQGRNKVARQFLDTTDGEWLLVLDTDMGFAPDLLERLVEAADPVERPVVGALCFAGVRVRPASIDTLHAERFKLIPTVYEWIELDDESGFRPVLDYPRDTVMPVAGTGSAAVLIHRDALAAVRARFGDEWYDPIKHPTALKGKPRTFSEDLSFCVRLAACGIPIHVDTGARTTHEKGLIYLDETTYEEQQRAAELAAE